MGFKTEPIDICLNESGLWSAMAFSNNISLIFCLAFCLSGCDSGSNNGDNGGNVAVPLEITPTNASICLSGCDGGSNNSNNASNVVLPLEITPTDASITTLDARQLDILDEIKQRSIEDGALYQFDDLNPVFVQEGDVMKVSFEFANPNTVGGSPIVDYSLTQNAITNIVYTQ